MSYPIPFYPKVLIEIKWRYLVITYLVMMIHSLGSVLVVQCWIDEFNNRDDCVQRKDTTQKDMIMFVLLSVHIQKMRVARFLGKKRVERTAREREHNISCIYFLHSLVIKIVLRYIHPASTHPSVQTKDYQERR
jgi:hypothetical protein